MEIAIPIFDRFTALDAVGPYEVLCRLPGARVRFVAQEPGPKQTETGMLTLTAEAALEDLPNPDVLVVPGGFGTRPLMEDEAMLDWIRDVHETRSGPPRFAPARSSWRQPACSTGLEATSHWAALDVLAQYGAKPTQRRVVEQGKIITAAGVSSGHRHGAHAGGAHRRRRDRAGDPAGHRVRPQPPFDSGSLAKAPENVKQAAYTVLAQHA